jgi:hypothetical protein
MIPIGGLAEAEPLVSALWGGERSHAQRARAFPVATSVQELWCVGFFFFFPELCSTHPHTPHTCARSAAHRALLAAGAAAGQPASSAAPAVACRLQTRCGRGWGWGECVCVCACLWVCARGCMLACGRKGALIDCMGAGLHHTPYTGHRMAYVVWIVWGSYRAHTVGNPLEMTACRMSYGV